MSEITNKFLMAFLVALAASSAGAETITGKVVGVSDGDTITVLDANRTQYKIRVAGIDAPEKAQAFGQRSKEAMSTLVFGKDVEVITSKHDRYGRHIGKVMVAESSCSARNCPKTLDAGLAQLTVGMAWGIAGAPVSNPLRMPGPTNLPSKRLEAVTSGCGAIRSRRRHGTGGTCLAGSQIREFSCEVASIDLMFIRSYIYAIGEEQCHEQAKDRRHYRAAG